MNAAFLLVTTAFLAGNTNAGCCGATCGTSCDTCCSGPKLLDRLRGAFHHNNCGCDTCAAPKCAAPCPAPKPVCAPVCAPTCAPKCDSCCDSRPRLLDRLRSAFHHGHGCCDGGCSSCSTCSTCGSGPVAAPGAPAAPKETIPTPPAKKMPAGGAPPAKTSIDAPAATFGQGSPAIQAAPNAGQAPAAIAPNVETENLRSPF